MPREADRIAFDYFRDSRDIQAVGFRLAKLARAKFDRSAYDADGLRLVLPGEDWSVVLKNPDYGLDRRRWKVSFDFTSP